MASVLGSSERVDQFRHAMTSMAGQEGRNATDTACRLIFVAVEPLEAVPASAAGGRRLDRWPPRGGWILNSEMA